MLKIASSGKQHPPRNDIYICYCESPGFSGSKQSSTSKIIPLCIRVPFNHLLEDCFPRNSLGIHRRAAEQWNPEGTIYPLHRSHKPFAMLRRKECSSLAMTYRMVPSPSLCSGHGSGCKAVKSWRHYISAPSLSKIVLHHLQSALVMLRRIKLSLMLRQIKNVCPRSQRMLLARNGNYSGRIEAQGHQA